MRHDAGERAIYVAQVPKITRRSRRSFPGRSREIPRRSSRQAVASTNFYMLRDALELYETQLLQLDVGASGNSSGHLCQGSICCNYDLAWRAVEGPAEKAASLYSYRVGVYDGWRQDQNVDRNYIRNCGLFACLGPAIEECGLLAEEGVSPQSRVIFTRLEIAVTYPQSREFLLMPDSLLDNLLPLEPGRFEWSQKEER